MDVIVVGGGPAGASAAYHAARSGLTVTIVEKSDYPREKVCGDGLTPRAVAQIHAMGIDTSAWHRTNGLRVVAHDTAVEIEWPATTTYPDYGLNLSRHDLDQLLVNQAVAAGAELRVNTHVDGPLYDAAGRVVGVTATDPDGQPIELPARLVIAADGVSARFGLALGMQKRENRPFGAAIRRYYTSPRHDDAWLETHHDVTDPKNERPLAGYGWIFPMGDGRVNVGLAALNTTIKPSPAYRRILDDWVARVGESWGISAETADSPIRGEGMPMGFTRAPHYTRGVMLVGDAGGMVNPFTGEGIAYALESGYVAAKMAALALLRRTGTERERVLRAYPGILRQNWGGYYRLGNLFVSALGHADLLRFATRQAIARPKVLKAGFRVMTNLTDPRRGGAKDRIAETIYQLTPAA